MLSDLISLADWSPEEIAGVLELAAELKQKQHRGEEHQLLRGKTLAMIFEKPSLRTRVTFQTGMYQLGGQSILIDTKLGERESVADVARNLERWVDGIMARTFSHQHLVDLAKYAKIPVINALSDMLHPCQILADAQTLIERKGKNFAELKVCFVGDGNNVFHSWANFAAAFPIRLHLLCPKGYEPDAGIVGAAQARAQGEIVITQDAETALKDADAVYTDVWTSMGQEEESAKRLSDFQPYQVNEKLFALAKPDALFMHCLPAHRGEEVTDGVMEHPRSVVFDQAENRLHAQKAVMVTLMKA